MLAGCGGDTASAVDPDIDLDGLLSDMLAADTTLPDMTVVTSGDEKGELNFTAFSDFDYSRVQAYAYAYAASGSEEIAVVQLKDSGDAAAFMSTLKDHLELRRGTLSEYAPDQVILVDHAVLKQKDTLVALIVSEKSGLVQQVFEAHE
jgi:hypothetical protein